MTIVHKFYVTIFALLIFLIPQFIFAACSGSSPQTTCFTGTVEGVGKYFKVPAIADYTFLRSADVLIGSNDNPTLGDGTQRFLAKTYLFEQSLPIFKGQGYVCLHSFPQKYQSFFNDKFGTAQSPPDTREGDYYNGSYTDDKTCILQGAFTLKDDIPPGGDRNHTFQYTLWDLTKPDIQNPIDSLASFVGLKIVLAKPNIFSQSINLDNILTFSADSNGTGTIGETNNGGGRSDREALDYRYDFDKGPESQPWIRLSNNSGVPVDGYFVDSVSGRTIDLKLNANYSSLSVGGHKLYLQVQNQYMSDNINKNIIQVIIDFVKGAPPPKYSCVSNACSQDVSGVYVTLADCQAVCPPPPPVSGGYCGDFIVQKPNSVGVTPGSPGFNEDCDVDSVMGALTQTCIDPATGKSGTQRCANNNANMGIGGTSCVWSSCSVPPPPNPIVCDPKDQTANTGQTITFSASGGTVGATWSAGGGANPATGSGTIFSTTFSSGGSKRVTVSNGRTADSCNANVLDTASNNSFVVSTSPQSYDISQSTTYNVTMQNSGNTTWTREFVWEGEDNTLFGTGGPLNDANAYKGKTWNYGGSATVGGTMVSFQTSAVPAGKHYARFLLKALGGDASATIKVAKATGTELASQRIQLRSITGWPNYAAYDLVFTNDSSPIVLSVTYNVPPGSGPPLNLPYFGSDNEAGSISIDRIWILPYRLGLGDGVSVLPDVWGAPGRLEIPGTAISPNVQASFDIPLTTPSTPGFYYARWKMVNELREWFGAQAARTVYIYNKAVSPANNETNVTERPSFIWTKGNCNNISGSTKLGPNVKGYWIQLSEDNALIWYWQKQFDICNTTTTSWPTSWDTTFSAGRASLGQLLNGKTYYWRVNMYDDQSDGVPGNNVNSPINKFDVGGCSGSGGCGPVIPGGITITEPNYCSSGPAVTIGWTYSDPAGSPQSAYQVQITNTGSFNNPILDTGKINSGSNSYFTGQGVLQFDTTYKARARVWNSFDVVSAWSDPSNSWKTPPYAYPQVDFNWTANGVVNNPSPPLNKPVSFTDATVFNGNPNGRRWDWLFGDGGTSTTQNPSHTYAAEGSYLITLTATYNANQSCTRTKGPLIIQKSIPRWREIAPR